MSLFLLYLFVTLGNYWFVLLHVPEVLVCFRVYYSLLYQVIDDLRIFVLGKEKYAMTVYELQFNGCTN